MYRQTSNIIKRSDFFINVVVECWNTCSWKSSEPAMNQFLRAVNLTQLCDFKGCDYRSCFMVVDVDCAVVEACQKPGFCGMEIDASSFDAI
jgi:hypothetical protein